jgi:rfaE bifunctional protein nucleotidyltransferase chain/domain
MEEGKLQSLDNLAAILDRLRQQGRRIVHCHGVFDLLHVGHVRHFEQARKHGDILVVTLTPDRYVNKGSNRPAFPEGLRAEVLASLACVDFVAVNQWPSAIETIRLLKPNFFAKGSEFRNLQDTLGHVAQESEAVREAGGEIIFTEDIVFSSSALVNQYLSQVPDNVKEFLGDFQRSNPTEAVLRPLLNAVDKRVLIVGETIIDEYTYCEAIGKSGKEPVMVCRYSHTERFGGGVIACANHAASFCECVDVLTFLGENGDEEPFVRGCLKANVAPIFRYKRRSPTIVKKRFLEQYLSQKMFEVYQINDDPLDADQDEELCATLEAILPNYDIVIVADYGHGMLGSQAIRVLCERAPFLAVNTQSNAGNHGFNTISRYGRADYISLANREFALEIRDRRVQPQDMIRHVAERLSCGRVMMTQGKNGCLVYSRDEGFVSIPAFTTHVLDRVGAGDAVLCVTALCAAQNAPSDVLGFIGNVVGAEAVGILGNQRSIERIPLCRHIECLLKSHHRAEHKVLAGPYRAAG